MYLQPSKIDTVNEPQKLKSIIITGSRLRLGSQDSSEKQVTFGESVNGETSSIKIKRVKFAEDTVFQQETKVKRGRLFIFLTKKKVIGT